MSSPFVIIIPTGFLGLGLKRWGKQVVDRRRELTKIGQPSYGIILFPVFLSHSYVPLHYK